MNNPNEPPIKMTPVAFHCASCGTIVEHTICQREQHAFTAYCSERCMLEGEIDE